ncbi:hypothetical protein ABTZ03_43130 [Kitasatospora sp. NPDC096077]|uniref:hypothetical protein n=1 Tax=Kitasatospora sp. NPDC096077 TaxID=3155544 RepID=UPI00331C25EA
MRMTIRRTVAAVAVTAAAAVMTTVGAGTAQASTWDNCPDGAVCVYGQDQPANTPILKLWSYGPHNLSNMYGNHWVLNNQTGGAAAQLCDGYNGTGNCHDYMPAQTGVYANLTPVNSIVLLRP